MIDKDKTDNPQFFVVFKVTSILEIRVFKYSPPHTVNEADFFHVDFPCGTLVVLDLLKDLSFPHCSHS